MGPKGEPGRPGPGAPKGDRGERGDRGEKVGAIKNILCFLKRFNLLNMYKFNII
jgi:hypothetical protein